MRIVLTGAAGDIGSVAADELADTHELVLIDRRRSVGQRVMTADLSRHPASRPWSVSSWLQRWPRQLDGADVVIHLGGDRRPSASWHRVVRHNIEATWNVFEAAAHYNVPRVIYASSNWAVKALHEELGPASWDVSGPKIDSDAPPRPRTPYGISKALGEIAGRALVDEGRIRSFVAMRIGHCPPNGIPYAANITNHNHWIGLRDMGSLMRRCVEADFEGFHVIYAVSGQAESPFDLSHTKKLLDWEPEERAEPLAGSRPS
jgi:nucleoside-diphosphate-sugar epimerase